MPVEYVSVEEVNKMTFKQFVSNQVRKHLPSVFRGLVSDWNALELWSDQEYLKLIIGEEFVEAIGFLREEPYQNYLGEGISMSQRGIYIKYSQFVDRYLDKFNDPEIKDAMDISNLIYR